MDSLTPEEKQLAIVMHIFFYVFLIAGFFFMLFPGLTFDGLNLASQKLFPSLPLLPASPEKYWLVLAFSFMMTITALSYMAKQDIATRKGYIIPILVSKLSTTVAGLLVFLFYFRAFAHLANSLVDFSIFLIILTLYRKAKASEPKGKHA
ncbi:MAG: hypothetical protein HYR55_07715 [Acidobacteria bacterium]|nr:hypothetical protein [Acidobacteriota bacterium]MBI3656597.1 hypothetical protein [Acidobacteriota bacterium]